MNKLPFADWAPHLQHRLTLLRCFRERERKEENWQDRGDFLRCAKDSALISIRLFCNAMGFGVDNNDPPQLVHTRRSHKDDVFFDGIEGGTLANFAELSEENKTVLAHLLRRANKELGHLTKTFDGFHNVSGGGKTG